MAQMRPSALKVNGSKAEAKGLGLNTFSVYSEFDVMFIIIIIIITTTPWVFKLVSSKGCKCC